MIHQTVEETWESNFGLFREYYLGNRADYVPSGIHHSQWAGILDNSLIQLPFEDTLGDLNFDPSRLIQNNTGKVNQSIVIQAPREHAKSSEFTVDYPIYELYKNPELRIVIVSSTKSIAEAFLREITMNLENNPLLIAERGSLIPTYPEKWTNQEIIVDRNSSHKDPSIAVVGSGGSILSRRADILICDDILNPDNVRTEDQRIKMRDWFFKVLYPILVPNGRLIFVGTIFHPEDLLTEFIKDESYDIRLRYKAILDEETQEVLWGERHSYESLVAKRKKSGSVTFNMAYQNEGNDDNTAIIKRSWIDKAKEKGLNYKMSENWNLKANPFGDGFVTTGVDLQSSASLKADKFAIVVLFTRYEDGMRIPIYVYRGEKNGLSSGEQQSIIADVYKKFGGEYIFVESNQYQEMLSRDMKRETSLPVVSFKTTGEKNDSVLGVNSLGILLENEKFMLIMKSDNMKLAENMRYLADGLQLYSPTKHTEDTVMALWFANVAARKIEQIRGSNRRVTTQNNLYKTYQYGKEEHTNFIQNEAPIIL